MAKPKTVVDLLSELPDEQLRGMREANRLELARAQAETARLSVEAQQIDQAITKRQRDGSPGRLTAQQVLETVRAQAGKEVSAADVVRLLKDGGIATTPNAVRNHLNRLVDRDELIRVGDRYAAPSRSQVAVDIDDFPAAAAADDDIPF